MTLAEAISGLTGTHEEVLAQVKLMTVTEPGEMSGGEVSGTLAMVGLKDFVSSTADS